MNPDKSYEINPELEEIFKKELGKFETLVTELGESRGWGGNPRWDLIIKEGIRAYLSGDMDKRS